MRTREENLSILRNASGGIYSAGGPSGGRIRTRDESLRILQTYPVILNREAVKNPENRIPGAENYGTLSVSDVGATLVVARPNVSPTGGDGVSPPAETKPMGSGGGGFSGGGGGRDGRTADNSKKL